MKGSLCRLAETSFLWRDTAMRIRERFNPHAPFEARRGGRLAPASNDRFNPRAPCGARLSLSPPWRTSKFISTHAPLAGRDLTSLFAPDIVSISTHAPLAGRDEIKQLGYKPRRTFQPTRPLRGATRATEALRMCELYFNPRAPCGARLAGQHLVGRTAVFQPTRPLRGATAKVYKSLCIFLR